MARRKDHTPEQIKALIRSAAEKLISHKGLDGLTARAVARAIGYTPGTIYNVYKDMDAVILAINYETLGRLDALCRDAIKDLPASFEKIRTLAHAYVTFARQNPRAWEILFSPPRHGRTRARLPKPYQERLVGLFNLIEQTLQECLTMSLREAHASARVLWACLHGITVLTLDGRLNLVGVPSPHDMIDDLLRRYASGNAMP